jgi:uncharacterized protein (TIGR03083 family)
MESTLLVRAAFVEATDAYLDVLDGIAPDDWGRPSIGDWTVRELVAHAARAFITIETYLDAPTDGVTVGSSAAYFATALDPPGIHDDVARRAHEQARAFGEDLVAKVHELADRVAARVAETSDDAVLGTFVGGIRLLDYLPSRVVELVVHTLDLTDALDRDPELPTLAATVALGTLAEVAAARPGTVDVPALVRGLTGRAPWPGETNVLG